MRNKILFFILIIYIIISNLIGREIGYSALFGNFKYIHIFVLIFLPLISLASFKKIFIKQYIILFVVLTAIPPIMAAINGKIIATQFNIVIMLMFFVVGFQTIDNISKLKLLAKIFLITWFIVILYKEISFLEYGTSIFFSLNNLRAVGYIRQSSDTINSLGLIVAVYFFLKISTESENKGKLDIFILLLALFVVFRYGIRGSYVTICFLAMTFYLFNKSSLRKKKIKLVRMFVLMLLVLFVMIFAQYNFNFDSFGIAVITELQKNSGHNLNFKEMQGEDTMLYRAAMLFDSIHYFSQHFVLLNLNNRLENIDYIVSKTFYFTPYENPHDSYILLLTNYGAIPFVLFIFMIYKILKVIYFYISLDFWSKVIFYSILSYVILAVFTPIYELPYQGAIFWIICGAGIRRALNLGYFLRNVSK